LIHEKRNQQVFLKRELLIYYPINIFIELKVYICLYTYIEHFNLEQEFYANCKALDFILEKLSLKDI